MRWLHTPKAPPPEPRAGDLRVVARFLWLPLRLPRADGQVEWRWLERAVVAQCCHLERWRRQATSRDEVPRFEHGTRLVWRDTGWQL